MYVTARPDVSRATGNWVRNACLFALASSLAGAGAGGVIGLIASFLPVSARAEIALVAAVALILLGAVALLLGRAPLLQCNAETPREWMRRGPIYASIRNGLALGQGYTTRIGFAAWYLIPFACFLIGDPAAAMLIYGSYGLARGASVGLWVVGAALTRRSTQDLSIHAFQQQARVQYLAAVQLLVLGMASALLVGWAGFAAVNGHPPSESSALPRKRELRSWAD